MNETWKGRVSPGTTFWRNFTLSIFMKYVLHSAREPSTEASTSGAAGLRHSLYKQYTGHHGFLRKWPWKKGSLVVTFFTPTI